LRFWKREGVVIEGAGGALSVYFALFAGAEEDCISGGRGWRGHFSKDGGV
jgi:hypothetical protein